MNFVPLNLSLELAGERVVLVGGGRVALRYGRLVSTLDACLVVVSPRIDSGLRPLPGVEFVERGFVESDVEGARLVFAATDDGAVNAACAGACRERGILCSVADAPELSTFHVLASASKGPLTIAVSTGGRSPVYARRLRDALLAGLPDHTASYVEFLGRARDLGQERILESKVRQDLAKFLASPHGEAEFLKRSSSERETWLEKLLKEHGSDD